MSLTAALGAEGNGAQVTWRGEIYTLMPVGLKTEQAFQAHMTMLGRIELAAMKPHIEPDDYAAAVAHFATIAPTRFNFWGDEAKKFRATPAGTLKLIHCMLLVKHPKLSEKAVMDMMTEEGEQIHLALQDFFQRASPEKDGETEPTPTLDLPVLTPEQIASMKRTA